MSKMNEQCDLCVSDGVDRKERLWEETILKIGK